VIWRDFAPIPAFGDFLPFGMKGSLDGAQVIFGGAMGDTAAALSPELAAGKLVVLGPPRGAQSPEAGLGAAVRRYAQAAGIAFAMLDFIPQEQMGFLREPPPGMESELPEGPLGLLIGFKALGTMFGVSLDSLTPGRVGHTVQGAIRFSLSPGAFPSRNVIAVVRGSDPALRNEYVVIGAHNDHVGTGRPRPTSSAGSRRSATACARCARRSRIRSTTARTTTGRDRSPPWRSPRRSRLRRQGPGARSCSSGTPGRRRDCSGPGTSPITRPCRGTRSWPSSTWTWWAGARRRTSRAAARATSS
jgi:hypothetical protein